MDRLVLLPADPQREAQAVVLRLPIEIADVQGRALGVSICIPLRTPFHPRLRRH
jgi:hypothetical protein